MATMTVGKWAAAGRYLDELRQDWDVRLEADADQWALSITSRRYPERGTAVYVGADLEGVAARAYGGAPSDRDY